MTLTTRITFAVASIIGFAVGAVYGCYKAEDASRSMQSAEAMSIPTITSSFAREQFEHADPAHARQAVRMEIKLLEQLERVAHQTRVSDAVSASESIQLALAYTRLALTEEADGQSEAARRDLGQAKARLNRNRPDKGMTDEQLKDTLKRFDATSDSLPNTDGGSI
jgi:hypothetical protein